MTSIRRLKWNHCLPEAIQQVHRKIDVAAVDWRPESDIALEKALIELYDLTHGLVHACRLIHPGLSVEFW